MIKIPQVKKDKHFIWEALVILGLSIALMAVVTILLYWYVFGINNEESVSQTKIQNAYKHPYVYPKYQPDNLLKSRLFKPAE